MYAVVGCGDCDALWVVAGEPETTACPRCGKRHRYAKLKQFVTTDDEDHAREVRASMLASRRGESDAYADLDSFADLEAQAADAGVSDDDYLARSGVDTDEVAAAGERASEGAGGGRSREETVRAALCALDEPTEGDVVEYAEARGVSAADARETLAKLLRAGEVSESRGAYRLV